MLVLDYKKWGVTSNKEALSIAFAFETASIKKEVNMKYSTKWLRAAGVRALKTMAQTGIATIGTAALLDEVNWVAVCSAALMAAILSLLTSLAGLPEVE